MSARIAAVNLLEIDEFLSSQPQTTRQAARLAINSIATRKAVPQFRKAMREEVNFPPGYVEDPDRFGVTKQATEADLSATVTARFRPTSLARFAPGQSFDGARRTGGVNVKVNKTGGAVRINRAFFVRLRQGKDTADGFNLGLAIRLKPGERLRGRKKGASGVELAPNLYLLYGPSVDQVFREV
ncbi:MAG: hypothetical protein ABFE01_01870, partial [Phycisphaerales bacterium]